MKVAVLSHWGFQKLHGGNLRGYFLVRELVARGHEVVLIVADPADVPDCREKFGIEVLCVEEPMSRWQPVKKKMVQYLVFGWKVKRLLDRSDFDAVFGINLIQALPAVFQRRARSWVMYVDLWADFFYFDSKRNLINSLISRVVRFAEFLTMRRADKLVMITQTMADLAGPEISRKVKVIPDGADTEMFHPGVSPELIRDRYDLRGRPVFSYQGGVAAHEGLNLLCEAAPFVLKDLPDAVFLIAGEGEFLPVCKTLVRRLGVEESFLFTGWLDYDEIPSVLAATDVTVVPMPDVRAAQPIISLKLLEGMASGTLVVANRLPGLSEVVDESQVVFTRAEDASKFGSDLLFAYRLTPGEKQDLIGNALNKIRQLDWREVARRDAEFYAQVATNEALAPGESRQRH